MTSLFNNKLQKVQMAMLGQDVQNKFSGYDSSLTQIGQQNNIKSVMNFLKKLVNKQNVKVGILGDSLVAGAGGTPYWYQLLFDETYRNSGHSLLADFNLPTNAISYDNYAIGGRTIDLMLAHVIPQMQCKGDSSGFYSLQASELLYTNPPALSKGYDLVIFEGGQNGGIYNQVIIEELARRLIENGIDVLMLSTQRNKNASSAPTFRDYYHKVAAYYGCALIDIDDLYKGNDNYTTAFANYYADSIHQSALAHTLWADWMRNLLSVTNANQELTPFTKKLPTSRLYWFTDNNRSKQKAYACYFVNLPDTTTGTTGAAVTGAGIASPVISQGLTQHTQLNAGQSATFNFDNAVYIIPIFGGKNAVSIVDYYMNASLSTPVTIERTVDIGYTTASTDFNIDYSLFNAAKSDYPSTRNLKLQVTSGSLNILGCIVFAEPCKILHKTSTEDYPTGVAFTGTWVDFPGGWINSSEIMKQTNTDQDQLSFTFTGKKFGGSFTISKGGGKIDVYIDGVKVDTLDTYANQGSMGSLSYQWDCGTYGKHSVIFKLNGYNASAIAPVTNVNPRFGVRKLYLFPDKYDITEKWWNDQKQASLSV